MMGQAESSLTTAADVSESALLGGRLRLRQPARGYRAGLDAALLAAAVGARPGERVIEAGCGAGAGLMQIAARRPEALLTGLERDAAAAELARQNAELNQAASRTTILDGDVAHAFRALDLPPFDWAISNPPLFDDPGALRAPAEGKRGAWMADDGLSAWTSFLLKAVREGGPAGGHPGAAGAQGRFVRHSPGSALRRSARQTGAGSGHQDGQGAAAPSAAVDRP